MKDSKTLSEIIKFMGIEIPKKEVPYLLTKEEEDRHIENKILSLEDHARWKMKDMGENPKYIDDKIKEIDFSKKFNRDEYLSEMNMMKYWNIKDEEYKEAKKQKEINDYNELKRRCNYAYMFRLLKRTSEVKYNREFIFNADNEGYIKALCYFMSEDERFETELGYNLSKGLLIRGKYGVGKTHAVRCLANNEFHPITLHSMIEIYEEVTNNGEYLAWYEFNGKVSIDDVGTEEEPVTNYYGTKINWFKSFIEKSYLKPEKYKKMIITTNNTFDELEKKYGGRARSRLPEMFNIIDVHGDDFRKSL